MQNVLPRGQARCFVSFPAKNIQNTHSFLHGHIVACFSTSGFDDSIVEPAKQSKRHMLDAGKQEHEEMASGGVRLADTPGQQP